MSRQRCQRFWNAKRMYRTCRRHTWKENVWPITQYVCRMFSSFPCPTWRYLEHSAKRWHCTILWQSLILFQPSVPECQVSRHFVSFCIEHVDGWHKSVKILMKADRLPRAHFHSSAWDLWGPEGPNVRADDAWGVVHDSYIFASGLGINPEVSTIRTISESVTLRSSLNTPASVCWSNYWGHQCGGRMVLRHLNPTCWGPWVADTWWILGGESANCPIYVLDYGHCSLPDLAAKGNCLWRKQLLYLHRD